MNYHVSEVALNGDDNFQTFKEEIWIIEDKIIITPHGNLQIENIILVE